MTIFGGLTAMNRVYREKLADELKLLRAGDRDAGILEIQGETLLLETHGKPHGNTYFAYTLRAAGFRVYLSDFDGQEAHVAVAAVVIDSLRLTEDGHFPAWDRAKVILERLGVVMTKNTWSRFDANVDLPDVPIGDLVGPFQQGHYVTRLRDDELIGVHRSNRKPTGFRAGRGELVVRVYDKLLELQKSGDEAKAEVIIQNRCAGELPDDLTRVEFQVRRGFSGKRWDHVSSVEQLFQALPAMMEFLTTDYFRMTEADVDRENRNQGRAKTSAVWALVQEKFSKWLGAVAVELVPKQRKAPEARRLKQQLRGIVESLIAARGYAIGSRDDFLRAAAQSLAAALGDDWESRLKRKQALVYAVTGQRPIFKLPES